MTPLRETAGMPLLPRVAAVQVRNREIFTASVYGERSGI